MSQSEIRPFHIKVPDAVIDDLRARLRHARWPEALDDPDWEYGIEQGYLHDLATYWAEQYDWRKHEAELNRFPQFTTEIEGQNVHFLHVRSEREDALPLVVTHGWPGSVAEFVKIIDPLVDPEAHGGDAADAFHVVAPSLPGFGFSQPHTAKGWEPGRIGAAWAQLMARLGYARYGAQGGDWGSPVSVGIARADAEHCLGIHVNFLFAAPPQDAAVPSDEDKPKLAGLERYTTQESGYAQIQGTKPQTVGYALHDSPVGQLAWIAEKFRTWTDCDGVIENAVTRDELLTNVMLYWVTGTAPSAGRIYRESRVFGDPALLGQRLETPVGFAAFPKEVILSPRSWLDAVYNLVQYTEMPRGGHFAALEQPELLVEDIRAFFRRFRD